MVGNLRSPSRDLAKVPAVDAVEQEVIRKYVAAHENAVVSVGLPLLIQFDRTV